MQFAAALVEYLISGTLAAAWLVPLFWKIFGVKPPIDEGWVIIYLPVAYVLGIFIDSTASVILDVLKQKERTAPQPYRQTTYILENGSEALGQAMQIYVSRDRIARGVFLNALLSALVLPATLPGGVRLYASCAAGVVAIWSLLTWRRLARLSKDFKDQAVQRIKSGLNGSRVELTDFPPCELRQAGSGDSNATAEPTATT